MPKNQWNFDINTHEFKFKIKRNKIDVINDVGTFILGKMNYYVAVDTGYLRSRNRAKIIIEGEKIEFDNDCFYAGYQEYGTRYQPGTPFMRPAAFRHLGDIKKIVERGLSRGI